jgi:hypothetical protein
MARTSRSRRRWIVATLALALSALRSPTLAASTEIFREGISVTVVEVPVTVLSDGRPVRGLTQADFEILDRGEPREITGFDVIDLTKRRTETVTVEPLEGESTPSPTATPVRGRHVLTLFDLQFTDRYHLFRCLEGAREMVRSQHHPRDSRPPHQCRWRSRFPGTRCWTATRRVPASRSTPTRSTAAAASTIF